MVSQFNEIVGKDWLKQAQEAKELGRALPVPKR